MKARAEHDNACCLNDRLFVRCVVASYYCSIIQTCKRTPDLHEASMTLLTGPCREFRPILKDCYSQDTSQSSRLQFELKKSEAQNLCRAFNNASARVNLGAGTARTASPAVASNSKAAGASSSSMAEPSKSEVP